MSIDFDASTHTFTLATRHTTYQLQVGTLGHLRHLYYGRRTQGDRLDYPYLPYDSGFAPNPYELRVRREISMDLHPQEYSGANTGDFRVSALRSVTEDGVYGTDLRYAGHSIAPGKFALDGLPASFAAEDDVMTLTVALLDAASGLRVELLYGVFEQSDVIARAARIVNAGTREIVLEKAASLTLDIPFGKWDLMHFYGKHTMERQAQRVPVMDGIQTIASRRGASSHQHNPFVILCDREATEDHGACCGVMLVYSGNHKTEIERDQMGLVRVVSGIHDEQFRWTLAPGDSFVTPEALLAFTSEGLTRLSHLYHRFLRRHVMRGKWNFARRPVLLNSWEATYYDFTSEKLLDIAGQASELGIEMLVLDDGWFGRRNSDNGGLGDWRVNESKLPGGLTPLIERINAMGMRFGIWVEPEMVSEDSDLYRLHPDWALTVPGRAPAMGRNQLVLDLSREDVREHLFGELSRLLQDHHIEYVKWDMNRSLTDVYSRTLARERQGEVFHRHILGVYALLDRLTRAFPDVLFEGCSGGGGRFDAGMLYYSPQIWCSDNTDAIDRLAIQYGTSFGYPVSAMGAHVSVCPNHQTGRNVPFDTRAIVAMHGTFGYELDPRALSDAQKALVRGQIARFDENYELIQNGDYYRLTTPYEDAFCAWAFAAPDGSELLVSLVVTRARPNANGLHFYLKGLRPDALYRLTDCVFCGCEANLSSLHMSDQEAREHLYSGAALMYAGFTLPNLRGDYPGAQLKFVMARGDA